jgi:hypothetical protein
LGLFNELIHFFEYHTAALSVITAFIIASCSIATFVLALIVFFNFRRSDEKNKKLIKELKIALIMIATLSRDADAAKVLYDEYEKTIFITH